MKKEQKKRKVAVKNKTWLQGSESYYLCKKCHGWFLLKNFNLQKGICRNCLLKQRDSG